MVVATAPNLSLINAAIRATISRKLILPKAGHCETTRVLASVQKRNPKSFQTRDVVSRECYVSAKLAETFTSHLVTEFRSN